MLIFCPSFFLGFIGGRGARLVERRRLAHTLVFELPTCDYPCSVSFLLSFHIIVFFVGLTYYDFFLLPSPFPIDSIIYIPPSPSLQISVFSARQFVLKWVCLLNLKSVWLFRFRFHFLLLLVSFWPPFFMCHPFEFVSISLHILLVKSNRDYIIWWRRVLFKRFASPDGCSHYCYLKIQCHIPIR